MIESISDEELKVYIGGRTNWGQVGGACVSGAILGTAFGNPGLGCLNSAAGSILYQEVISSAKSKKRKKRR